jgi:hypothetical protein
MKELEFQARLVKDTKTRKGWGRKMAQKHESGMPDVFLKMQNTSSVFVECKKNKLNLSEIQRETIRRMQAAGIFAGWAVYLSQEGPATEYNIMVGADPDASEFTHDNATVITLGGKVWEVDELIRAVVYWSERQMDLVQ